VGYDNEVTDAAPAIPLVVVVGDVMNDVVVRPQTPVEVATDTDSEIGFSFGGSAANQAAWLGALGARVRFAGRAGSGDAADHERALAQFDVDVRLGSDATSATGTVVALVSPDGERSMFTDRGANRHLSAADLEGLLEGASLLHVSAYQFFEPKSRPAVRALWEAAAGAGIPRSVDPASFAAVRDAGRDAFFEWTSGARLVFPNLDEGRQLSGKDDPEAIVTSLLDQYPLVALKLGPGGALAGTADGTRVRLSPDVTRVLDSTGAGDAFCAGFLARFVRGEALGSCTAGAATAAALVMSQTGARPDPAEIAAPN
jgi:sugar/nucleoside kinase (ribokinase family)